MDARNTLIAAAIGFCALLVPAASQAGYENLGRHLSKEELAGWDIDVSVDGKGFLAARAPWSRGKRSTRPCAWPAMA